MTSPSIFSCSISSFIFILKFSWIRREGQYPPTPPNILSPLLMPLPPSVLWKAIQHWNSWQNTQFLTMRMSVHIDRHFFWLCFFWDGPKNLEGIRRSHKSDEFKELLIKMTNVALHPLHHFLKYALSCFFLDSIQRTFF